MSVDEISPRVLRADAPRVPLQAPAYNPTVMVLLVGGTLVLGAYVTFAAKDEGLGFQILTASLAVILAAMGVAGLRWAESITERLLRIDSSASGLRFVASHATRALFPILAVMGLVPPLVAFTFEVAGVSTSVGSTWGRWGPYAVGVAVLFWLAQQVWSLRTPPGLTLTEHGLRGVRGAAGFDMAWDDLGGVSVTNQRGATLVFHRASGLPVVVEPRWTGSDPNSVAAIVAYFLEHPADRPLLADPRAAIRRVEDAVAGR